MYINGARVEKAKGKYSFFSNLLFHYKNLIKWEPKMFWITMFFPFFFMVANIIGNMLPSVMVEGLEQHWELTQYIGTLAAMLIAMWLGNMVSEVLISYIDDSSVLYRQHYSKLYVQKQLDVDYDVLESKEFQTHASVTYTAIYNGRGINNAVYQLPSFVSLMLPGIYYGVVLAKVSIWILVAVALCAYVQVQCLKFARVKHSEAHPILSKLSKKMAYLTSQTMEAAAGKDIRMYGMQNWLMKKYDDNLSEMNDRFFKIHLWYYARSVADCLLSLIRNGLVYGYLIYLASNGSITMAEFVLYYGFTSSFSMVIFKGLRDGLSFGVISNTFGSIREFLDTPERRNGENCVSQEIIEKIKGSAVSLELRDVSFTYPNASKPTIHHMNLKIAPGEKLALIGLNGAGKTTLVKLICGFYQPTEGEILLNDIPIEQFERRQYYELLSVLFQDFTLLPTTLQENIASDTQIDMEKLYTCMEQSDFHERYERLPQKGESLLIREVYDKAVDFSGGEKQKLLLSRALYKDATLLILDEPTAALDPIAENEIYLKYGELSKGRTSIYISHRLSSTRFCDRIVLLEHGTIVESGTHDSLMAANGRYAELYEMQSRYYREQQEQQEALEKEQELIREGII